MFAVASDVKKDSTLFKEDNWVCTLAIAEGS